MIGQLGLLTGVGLAFAVGGPGEPAQAEGQNCGEENPCAVKKPAVLLMVDYSTSMSAIWDVENQLTRWEVTVAALQAATQPGSFLGENTQLALMRFGHDPEPGVPGTTIDLDPSGLVDGQKLEVAWLDENDDTWLDCSAEAVVESLAATPAPPEFGIGTWTKGALDRAQAEVAATRALVPDLPGEQVRSYVAVVLTDGLWTGADGTTALAPADQDPAITATALLDEAEVPTYVITIDGDAQVEEAADALAFAGGTGAAFHGETPGLLDGAIYGLNQELLHDHALPGCSRQHPRVMVLLDASSSTLNDFGGTVPGTMGETAWDEIRAGLTAPDSLFDVDEGLAPQDMLHVGLTIFGHDDAPEEQRVLASYGPCMRDNLAWALDPEVSCVEPGCDDPWGGPTIAWTYQDGSAGPPGFDLQTNSHMPRCEGPADFCWGSGTFTHRGLETVRLHQIDYAAASQTDDALYPTAPDTPYINILITDGMYSGYSSDAQVQSELEAMFNAGITTYVIGYGDLFGFPDAVAQVEQMADWGSGGANDAHLAQNQVQLEDALYDTLGPLEFDPCCALLDCSENPEPTTEEPDPGPSFDDDDDDGSEFQDSLDDLDADLDAEWETEAETENETETETETTDGPGEESPEDDSESTEDEGSGSGDAEDEIGDDTEGGGEESGGSEGSGEDPEAGCDCEVDGASGPRGWAGLAGLILLVGLGGRRRRLSSTR